VSTDRKDFRWSTEPAVQFIDSMGDDQRIGAAARVSTLGERIDEDAEIHGLINYLVEKRHGSPFEHMLFTWRVTAPLFVWREHHRHRIASYNEESARYRQMEPHFYIPAPERNLVQIGKPGAYEYIPGTVEQHDELVARTKAASMEAYWAYEDALEMGIAREIARITLPVNTMSTCYVTMNARALMNFLSLRTKREGSHFPSFPQREIEMVAERYESDFARLAPLTYTAFNKHGRVAP
jgi:thymidylate synthase (FAD)